MNQFRSQPALRRLLLSWMPVILWSALIFYFSSRSSFSANFGLWDFLIKKAAHFAEFAVLSLLLVRALRRHSVSFSTSMPVVALLALAYAFSDELHQSFVPGRTSTICDVGFDLAGITTAMLVVAARRRGQRLRRVAPENQPDGLK